MTERGDDHHHHHDHHRGGGAMAENNQLFWDSCGAGQQGQKTKAARGPGAGIGTFGAALTTQTLHTRARAHTPMRSNTMACQQKA